MVKTLKMSKDDKEVLKQLLESAPAKNIGELRKVDKLCVILEKDSDNNEYQIDDDLLEMAKDKIQNFDGQFVAMPAVRKKTLRVADILEGKDVPIEEAKPDEKTEKSTDSQDTESGGEAPQ